MDEQNKPAEQPTETVAEPVAPEAAPERPAWAVALDEAPAEELRKHDRIAGVVGSELERSKNAWEATQRARIAEEERAKAEEAVEQAEKDLDELYNANPLTFADQLQNKRLIERQQKRVVRLQNDAIQTVSKRFGAAYQALPEFKQLVEDPKEFAALMQALQGKSDDEVPLAWHVAVTDGMTRIRAGNLAETQVKERLDKEKAAWEEEAAARGLVTSTRPDIRRGSRTATLDPEPDWRSPQYQAWYERNTPGAKRSRR